MTNAFATLETPASSSPAVRREAVSAGQGPKVLFVQTQAENAGAQEVARQLALGAASHGCRTKHVFFFRRTDAFDSEANVVYCARRRPSTPFGLLKLLFTLFQEFRREAPDAVVCFQHYGNVIAAPLARLAGVKTVVANQVSAPEHISALARALDYWLGRLGVYDSIVFNSATTEAEYASYPASYLKRCVRIDHGFMDKSAPIEKARARQEMGLPAEVELLGCSARLHPLKRVDLAIRLLAVNTHQHLVLAGQGPDLPRLEALARELGVEDRLHFAGELSTQKMGYFLAALDGFVFPSATETFGLAPVEAAQAGVPTVVNDLEVLRDVLKVEGEPCALFVDAADTPAFAAAARRVFEDPALAATLSARGRRLKDRFPLDAMVDAFMKLIPPRAA